MTEPPDPGLPSPRRRQVLRGLAIPPAAAALAGCSLVGPDGADPIVEDLKPGDTTGFPGAIRFGDEYAMEVARGAGGETLSGRFHGQDRVLEFEADGNVVRTYVVDGDGYVVTAGRCVAYPDVAAGLESVSRIEGEPASGGPGDPGLRVIGKTTIDGNETLVLELPPGGLDANGAEVTYYVDDGTRHPRRIETGRTTVEYHSWGDVEPVEPPDPDCRRDG